MLKQTITTLLTSSFLFISSLVAEQTLSLIKPDAVAHQHVGEIIALFESNGLHIAGLKMVRLSEAQAGEFYAEHKNRPFYPDLVKFMSSGPIVAIVLEGDNAVNKNRELMGATDPKQAAPGTIRAKYAASKSENAVHGSDSAAAAKREIALLFTPQEIVGVHQ